MVDKKAIYTASYKNAKQDWDKVLTDLQSTIFEDKIMLFEVQKSFAKQKMHTRLYAACLLTFMLCVISQSLIKWDTVLSFMGLE